MATIKSVLITDLDRTPAVRRGTSEGRGVPRRIWSSVEFAANGTGPHTIRMWRVPKGARVTGGHLMWDALGGAVSPAPVGACGDDDDSDRFMSTNACNFFKGSDNGGGTGRFDVVYVASSYTTDEFGNVAVVTTDGAGVGYKYTCEKDVSVYMHNVNPTGTLAGWIEITED